MIIENLLKFTVIVDSFFIDLGYNDISDVWKQEVDLPDLDIIIDSLMQQIKPFYRLLHGVLRNNLWNRINKFEPFNKASTIPAHMLGVKNAIHNFLTNRYLRNSFPLFD